MCLLKSTAKIFATLLLLIIIFYHNTTEISANNNQASIYIVDVFLNNEKTELLDNNTLTTHPQDAVKLVGKSLPNDKVRIVLQDENYDTIADEYGNWMILFSILKSDQTILDVEAESLEENSERTHLFRIEVITTEPESTNLDTNKTNNVLKYILYISIPLLISFLIYGFYLYKKKK